MCVVDVCWGCVLWMCVEWMCVVDVCCGCVLWMCVVDKCCKLVLQTFNVHARKKVSKVKKIAFLYFSTVITPIYIVIFFSNFTNVDEAGIDVVRPFNPSNGLQDHSVRIHC